MFCAECAKPLAQRDSGGWLACCSGQRGYWSELKPLPGDQWWPLYGKAGLRFYPGFKCEASFQPKFPGAK